MERIILKLIFNKTRRVSCASKLSLMLGCCGHGNEHWGSIKLEKHLNELSNNHFLEIRAYRLPRFYLFMISPCCGCGCVIFKCCTTAAFNPLNPELNPICYLLALLGAHYFLHVSGIRVKLLTFRRLMSYIYGAPILDVSRSHTTTQYSR